MTWAVQPRIAPRRWDRFATEWALDLGEEYYSEQPSGEAQRDGRAPVSSSEETMRPNSREPGKFDWKTKEAAA
jgi:hypothetical protein